MLHLFCPRLWLQLLAVALYTTPIKIVMVPPLSLLRTQIPRDQQCYGNVRQGEYGTNVDGTVPVTSGAHEARGGGEGTPANFG